MIRFAGGPVAFGKFKVGGGRCKEFSRAKGLFYTDYRLFARLMEKLTRAVTECLQLQIDAGVDAVQIFDSLGGLLAENVYEHASARWITQIISGLKGKTPVPSNASQLPCTPRKS